MKIKNTIKFNTYNILSEAITQGINWGWIHAHKHSNTPSEDTIKDYIYEDIMNSLSEIFNYES